ncbi:hypothetical protein GRF59_24810 [Paenibacillus sp. HJL G12]|uniref:Uncharacterized protein n=1 Tax=Paenibacillus dendrobii TaxID=2691084 RepID=A0A7X3LK10_9BACL|nr:hypothetical protein [Paenibacillus dendrobii]MWV46835.1 hypothetical protein [Paenibacillus dendrobii]
MTLKYRIKQEAAAGTFDSFVVGADEIVLTSVTLEGVAEGDRIVLAIDVSWLKPLCDLGELEFFLRKGAADGPVIYWTLETCYAKARTKENYTLIADSGMRHFFLTVKSTEQKARLVAYALEGSVYSPA